MHEMKTYVAEIDGRAVLAFVPKEREADAWQTSEANRVDRAVLENEGRPLWDGESEISVRYASNGETARRRPRGDPQSQPSSEFFQRSGNKREVERFELRRRDWQ